MGVAWPSANALTLPYLPSLRPLRPLRPPLSPTPPPPPPAPLLPPPSPESECLEKMSRRREGYRGTMWGRDGWLSDAMNTGDCSSAEADVETLDRITVRKSAVPRVSC